MKPLTYALIGAGAIGAFVWWRRSKMKAPTAPARLQTDTAVLSPSSFLSKALAATPKPVNGKCPQGYSYLPGGRTFNPVERCVPLTIKAV